MSGQRAVILGASGLVGNELLQQLLADRRYGEVVALVRRELPVRDPKLKQRVCDFEKLDREAEVFGGSDVFCCLGTTIRKAGSQAAFRRVDHDYPLEAAKLAAARGARKFLIITALGSDARSRVFYNRVKGELEGALRGLSLPEVHVFRPSILAGERHESRPGERVGVLAARVLQPLLVGGLKRYRPTPADLLAYAMLKAASREAQPGFHVHENESILSAGR